MALRFAATDAATSAYECAVDRAKVAARHDPTSATESRKKAMRLVGARLLAERGLDGTNLEDIARRADVPRSAMFAHYPNRRALISAILYEHANELQDRLDAVDPVPLPEEDDTQLAVDPVVRLEAVARALLDAMADLEPAQRVLIATLHTLPTVSQDHLRFLHRAVVWRVQRILPLAIPRLARRPRLAVPLAMSFVAMGSYFILWSATTAASPAAITPA